jgi:hypothetical protein
VRRLGRQSGVGHHDGAVVRHLFAHVGVHADIAGGEDHDIDAARADHGDDDLADDDPGGGRRLDSRVP